MSRVTVTDIEAGVTDVTITEPNATINDWNTESADVDEENVARGGIHQRNIADDTVTPAPTGTFTNSTTTTNTNSSWAVAQVNAVDVDIGDFTVDTTTETLMLFLSLEYDVSASDSGAGDDYVICEFKLQYSANSGSSWTDLAGTTRKVGLGIQDFNMHGSLYVVTKVTASISGSLVRFRLVQQQATVQSGHSVDLKNCQLFLRRIKA